jgi:hypothetical protein
MCRNIKTLFNFDPPATDEEIRDAALQFVRKLSGFNAPSKPNREAFDTAIDGVAAVAHRKRPPRPGPAPPSASARRNPHSYRIRDTYPERLRLKTARLGASCRDRALHRRPPGRPREAQADGAPGARRPGRRTPRIGGNSFCRLRSTRPSAHDRRRTVLGRRDGCPGRRLAGT